MKFPGGKFKNKDSDVLIPTSIKIIVLMLVSISIGAALMLTVDYLYRATLTARVNTIAQALDTNKINAVADSNMADEEVAEDYDYLKQKLAAVHKVNEDSRFVYLMANKREGVYFLADSEPVGSEDESPRGQMFEEASPELKNMFTYQQALIEGPVSDRWGTWLSVLAPISNAESENLIAVVGMDVPASAYITYLALAGAIPITLGISGSLVVYAADRVRRRRLESLQFRSELISVASHELRSPLTGIRWSEETFMHTPLTNTQKIIVDAMYASTLRLQDSIEDILQMASMSGARAQQIVIENTDITEVIEGIFTTQKLTAAHKGVVLKRKEDWPEKLEIACDSKRIKRVLNNLVSNSVKYTREKTEVVVGYKLQENKHIIYIADKGIGIPKDEQSRVFNGFYRASNAVKGDTKGTGMGLYLSKTEIERHGGKLWFESVENEGTTVYIELPIRTV